jgi:hypothetical protein
MDTTGPTPESGALPELTRAFRLIVEASPDPIAVYDHEGRLAYVNPAFEEAFLVSAADVLDTVPDIVPSEEAQGHDATLLRLRQGRSVPSTATRRHNAMGMELDVLYSATPLTGEDGAFLGHVEFIKDVTELKMMEYSLSTALERFRILLETSPDPVVSYDAAGGVSMLNQSFERQYGWTRDAIAGNELEFVPAANRKETAAAQEKVLQGESVHYESRRLTSDGKLVDVAVSAAPFHDPQGQLMGWTEVLHDITERKVYEERLRRANQRLRELDKVKTDFLSTVSHELRTPLTSILGFAEMIKLKLEQTIGPALAEAETPAVRKAVGKVSRNIGIIVDESQRLTTLINDVLDIAKMEAGKVEWKHQPVSLAEVVERAVTSTSSLIEHSGLEFRVDQDQDLPVILGDRDRLIQVLINLVSNAVKFTKRGFISVSASREEDGATLTVADTGVGIGPEDKDKIFEKFKQVGDTLTDKPQGTGLGLAICKQIVEHHKGSIRVDSQPGGGSVFTIFLPAEGAASRRLTTGRIGEDMLVRQLKRHMDGRGDSRGVRTVLVVDDEANIRELLRQELEGQGFRVVEAADGLDAIEAVKRHHPDLVTLDVMMPRMSGFDAAAVLKNDPLTQDIPIVMVSVVDDEDRSRRVGVDKYFTKPLDVPGFLEEVNLLMAQGRSHKKVMVLDENADTLQSLGDVLAARGYSVYEAGDPQEALDQALEVKPDMVVVNAPLSLNREVVQTLRFERGLENIYFLLLGAPDRDDAEEDAR